MEAPLKRDVGVSFVALLASTGTLICCVLPAVMVSVGAGAALAGLVTAVPQLVWLSAHKAAVFTVAGVLVAASGIMLWKARRLPCPSDPAAARSCARLRRISVALWALAATCIVVGVVFAFLVPALNAG